MLHGEGLLARQINGERTDWAGVQQVLQFIGVHRIPSPQAGTTIKHLERSDGGCVDPLPANKRAALSGGLN